MKNIIIGNWKMNKNVNDVKSFMEATASIKSDIEYGVAPVQAHLAIAKDAAKGDMIIAAQDCSNNESGAFTGQVSAAQLKDLNVTHCIIGHSERRQFNNETNQTVNEKIVQLQINNIKPIVCCGETEQEFDAGKTKEVIETQITEMFKGIKISNEIAIAYEPIWAIGTGKTATADQANDVCKFIKEIMEKLGYDLSKVQIMYGGSVKPANIAELLGKDSINGALVGGASLKPEDFMGLLENGK